MSLSRAYFRDRQRRARTLRGRRAALRATMAQIAGLASDAQVLLGDGIREQALKLQGMLTTVGRVRLIFLTFLQRGLQIWILLLCQAFIIDVLFHGVEEAEAVPHFHFLHFVHAALPTMHPIYWIAVIALAYYVLRLLRSVRNAIVRLG